MRETKAFVSFVEIFIQSCFFDPFVARQKDILKILNTLFLSFPAMKRKEAKEKSPPFELSLFSTPCKSPQSNSSLRSFNTDCLAPVTAFYFGLKMNVNVQKADQTKSARFIIIFYYFPEIQVLFVSHKDSIYTGLNNYQQKAFYPCCSRIILLKDFLLKTGSSRLEPHGFLKNRLIP